MTGLQVIHITNGLIISADGFLGDTLWSGLVLPSRAAVVVAVLTDGFLLGTLIAAPNPIAG